MVRKSSTYFLFIFLLLLIPGQLLALGLGEIEVDSALNQPLNAQIGLISARADELEEMRVELAPANVFDRVGVPRPYFLTQLKFKPVSLPGGGTVIRVTSKDPVREPFLTFLVEVTWPKGRLLREYTVLLDPPEFAQQQAPQIATPVTTPATQEPIVQEELVEAEPVSSSSSTTQTEVMVDSQPSAEDLQRIREQMDRELGISEADVVEESVPEEPVVIEPTADELEEAVAETIDEAQPVAETVTEEVLVAEELVSEEVVENDSRDIDVVRAEMDHALGIEGTEPVTRTEEYVTDEEVIAHTPAANEHVVEAGDTLYAIAKPASQANDVTVNQMMIAIQQANPDAFIRDNINLLKKGKVLRIPEVGDAQAVEAAQARQQISQQNALWREYRGNVSQIAATNVDAPELVKEKSDVAEQVLNETVKKEPETAKQDLNILATDGGEQTGNNLQVAGGEELKKLQNEVTLTKELAESRTKEAEELKSRVQALESMLEKKEKILNIQNQQLKDLQQQLSTEEDKATAAEKMLQEKTAQAKAAQEKAAQEVAKKPEVKPTAEEIKKPVVEPLPEFKEPVIAKQTLSKPRLEPLPDWDSLPEIEPVPEETVAEAEVKPEEVKPEQKPAEVKPEVKQVETPKAEPGFMAGMVGFIESLKERVKGVLLPLVAGILLLLGGIWFWRKKSVKTVELTGLGDMPFDAAEDGEHFDDILDETIVTPQTNASVEVEDEDLGSMDDLGLDDEDINPEVEASGDAELGEDVLDEADVYISYGLHQQAQDLLTDAITKEPDNSDYKAKLAEVYYSQKDQEGFEQYAEKIKDEVGESSAQWQNIIAMGKELAPSSALFAGAAAIGVAAKSALDKPDEADVDIGLQTVIDNPLSDENLEDTFLDNDAATDEDDGGLDFNVEDPMAGDDLEDDPVASKIMEANETSDILNFEIDDISDDELDGADTASSDADTATDVEAMATGLHETASMDDLTQELEQIGMQTTMNDLTPLDIDEDELDNDIDSPADDTIAMQASELGIDTGLTPADPEATAAYSPSSSSLDALAGDDTEQYDPSNIDTEFLDPAEQTIAQTHTDLEELGPPSLIEEVGTKLDLAKAFVDMGDSDAAKETLIEVINEGDESQIKAAKDLMDKLGS